MVRLVNADELPFQLVESPPKARHQNAFMRSLSVVSQRLRLANLASLQFGGLRDMYKIFGYKKSLSHDDYLAKYIRQDITSRIIDAPPNATWTHPPEILNESIATAWDKINESRTVNLWNTMYRADRLARLGPYSLILFGFDDTGEVQRPASDVRELLYARPIGARSVANITLETNPLSPRFGMPKEYKINFDDPENKSIQQSGVISSKMRNVVVHYSRIVHIVENPLEDDVFGIPMIEKIYNLLDDLLKVSGGTSEMYWMSARSGMQADIDKDQELEPADTADLEDEIDDYMHQLRRVIKTRGVDLKILKSEPPDPSMTFEMIISLLSGATGIPKRILIGSEAGQLASEQDRANWAERIDERRLLFSEPRILRPVIDTLQDVGLLPEGTTEFEWPSAFILSPLEGSMTMAQTARAIGNISRQTGNKTPMQITSRKEGRSIIGLEDDLPDGDLFFPDPEDQDPQQQAAPPVDDGGGTPIEEED